MKYTITILFILATLIAAPTAASACSTLSQARASHPMDYLKYRIINNQRCWYPATKSSRGKAVPAKQQRLFQEPASRNVGEAPGPSTLAADRFARASARLRGEPTPDRVTDVFIALNYFALMPWHEDMWLRIQVYWLRANGAFGVSKWVVSARWP